MKALLLDADGVILEKGEYFSERFAREYGVKPESVMEFFKGPYLKCQSGLADLKIELEPYLEKWRWTDGVESFLDYWFNSDFTIDKRGAALIAKFQNRGVRCYMASNNERYRAEFIEEKLREKNLLDGYYFSYSLKRRKENPDFFTYVLNDLSLHPTEVCFVDNDQKNVNSASSVGIQSYLYNDEVLNELLINLK